MTILLRDLLENPRLLDEAWSQNLPVCEECQHPMTRIGDTYEWKCVECLSTEILLPTNHVEPTDFGLRALRRGFGSNLGPGD